MARSRGTRRPSLSTEPDQKAATLRQRLPELLVEYDSVCPTHSASHDERIGGGAGSMGDGEAWQSGELR